MYVALGISFQILMESVASTSSAPDHPRPRLPWFEPSQAMTDRIVRALHHHLRLHTALILHSVLGATGNVYIVSLLYTPSCTCPNRITPCKHMLFVYIRALGVSLDDICLWQRTLRPCQLNRLLTAPAMTESLAEIRLRRVFHQQFFQVKERTCVLIVDIEDGAACPVCLDDLKDDRVVACTTCRNLVHEDCFSRWKRSKGRRNISCVVCRARWKDTNK
ncbi:LOW QUALITY PROTEIN: mitogen-activated protein kinase kinase kinase 1 [Cucurbita maxima]|uniref:LOW QUALITY PROTEIN: mitogen-activated protein kinase kinase kinase 1 n=1 Tax=Cucurbita maxima TaxID=3661 RepID=A0A6J1KP39_CUCMA|nr:LOW QUALITY PROTEIN: mitogen-activated protein kinase kinase kinase 1 [Cucurbita maxima]